MQGIPELRSDVLNYIGGKWEAAASGKSTERYDPADTSVLVARAPDSAREDAKRAIDAAHAAESVWRDWTAPRRGRLLFEWLKWIDARRDALAEILTREEGKILSESKGEVGRAMDILEFTAGLGRRFGGQVFNPEESGVFCYSTRQPLGVVGLISPWNFPVAIPVWKMAPALIAGNTVVLKPSPLTPLTAAALVAGLEAVGLPPGVVNLVHGDSEPGAELTANEKVQGVSFTGSTKVGKLVSHAAADRLLKLQLELGGKNPQIILEDADIDRAVNGAVLGAFGSTGQRCTATSRAIVVGKIYDQFLERLVERAQTMRVGSGMIADSEIGPLVDQRALNGVNHYREVARKEGARFCTPDQLPDDKLSRGHFIKPTVVEADQKMEIAREEVFGPLLSVIRARDLSEALQIANSVRYGLTSSIYTRDVGQAFKFAEKMEAGMVHVNRPGIGGYSHVPFGGIKDSGFGGREVGDEVLGFYTETKTVYINYD